METFETVEPEKSVLSFLNNMLYKIKNSQVTKNILNDETYYLNAPEDGSRSTFIPFSEVIEIVNSDDEIKNKKAVLKVVALKRLRLAVSITKKEIVIPMEVEYLMKFINYSSENMYLDEQESVQILYNSAYAAEIARPETVHRVQKLISPLLYWNVEEQRFRLIIEPNLGTNRIKKAIAKMSLDNFFLDENTPKLNVIQSSLMHHYSLENQDVVSNLPDKISIIHIKEGPDSKDNVERKSVPFIKPPAPKYTMDQLKEILIVTKSEEETVQTLDYIKYLYKKLDNALEEYYTKIVILFKVTDDILAKKDADLLLESRSNIESKGHWSDFDNEPEPEYSNYDPRKYFNKRGGDGGLISGPLLFGGLCFASPFFTAMFSKKEKATAVVNLLKETNEKFSNFMNELFGLAFCSNENDNVCLNSKFKAILGKNPTWRNVRAFLTANAPKKPADDDIGDISEAMTAQVHEIQTLQNMIDNKGNEAIPGPTITKEDIINARDKLYAMGQRILNQTSNDTSDQAVNDLLALPDPVKVKYENNKTSLTNIFESVDINSKQDYIFRFYKGITKFLKALNKDIRENTEVVKQKLNTNVLLKDINVVKEYYDEIQKGIAQQKQKEKEYLKKGFFGKALEKGADFVTFTPKAADYVDKAAQLHTAYTTGQIPAVLTNAVGLGLAKVAKYKNEVNLLSASWIEFMAGLKTVLARLELAMSTIAQDYYEATLNLMIEMNKINTYTSWVSLGMSTACVLGSGGLSWKSTSRLLSNPSTQAVVSGIQRVQQALPAAGTVSAAAGTIVQWTPQVPITAITGAQAQFISTVMDSAGTSFGSLLAYPDVEDALNNVFQPKLNPEITENLNNLLANSNISDLDTAINTTKPGQITLLSDENFKKEVVGPEIGNNLTHDMVQQPQYEHVFQQQQQQNLQGRHQHGPLLSGFGKRKKKRRTRRKRKKKRTRRKIKKRKKNTRRKRKKSKKRTRRKRKK